MRPKRTEKISAQSLMEYTLVLGVITIIVFTMGPLIKRGNQGMIKFVADQMSNQQNADQVIDDNGYLESIVSRTNASSSTRTEENVGVTTYHYDDRVVTSSSQNTDLGFNERAN